MVAAGRLVGLARAGAASQPGSDGGRTDEQEKIPPLDRHPDTLPRVRRPWDRLSGDQCRLSNTRSVRLFSRAGKRTLWRPDCWHPCPGTIACSVADFR